MLTLKDKLDKVIVTNKCINCVNFLELTKHLNTCDYDNFENVDSKEAQTYTAQQFGCNKFEYNGK